MSLGAELAAMHKSFVAEQKITDTENVNKFCEGLVKSFRSKMISEPKAEFFTFILSSEVSDDDCRDLITEWFKSRGVIVTFDVDQAQSTITIYIPK